MNVHEALLAFRGHTVPHFRIIERKRLWFTISGFLIVISLIGLFARGLNFSIDFKGGSLLKYPCPECATGEVTADDVSARLAKLGFSDATVQVVNGDTLTVRTKSLTTLGSRPATILRIPNTSGVPVRDVQAVLASFGHSQSSIATTEQFVTIKTKPLSTPEHGITLSYDNSKTNVTEDQIRTTLQQAGYPGAEVSIFGSNVVVRFDTLPANPEAAAAASPTPTPSGKAGATPTPSASPAPAGRDEVIAKLAGQAGVTPADVTVRNLSEDATEDTIVAAVADAAGVPVDQIQIREITGQEQQRVLDDLAAQAGTTTAQISRQDVGPTWGAQISNKAIKGLIIFLILVTLYIAMRFEWKMAVAGQAALLHDIIITAGIYALVGRTVTPATVIAILTILGYSLYDTVVIFDKVQENTASQSLVARETYTGVVDMSLNQVLMRSVNTSLVVLLPILSLLLFGGSTLKDFAFALFIGVAIGAYSSIFVASPVLAVLKEREPKNQQIRQRVLQRASRPQLRPVPAGDGGDGAEREVEEATGTTGPSGGQRPAAARPPKKKRKTTAAQRRRR